MTDVVSRMRRPAHGERGRPARYATGVLLAATATGVSLGLSYPHGSVVFPFLAAAAVAVWYVGLGPGVLVAGAGCVATWALLARASSTMALSGAGRAKLLAFVASAVLIVLAGHALRKARDRADAARRAAEDARDAAELARREAESERALLAAMNDAAPVGLGMLDRDLVFTRVNRTLADINSLPVQDHLGRQLREALPALPAEVERISRDVVRTGRSVVNTQVSGRRTGDGGRRMHVLASWYPVRDADREVVGLGTIVVDVTDRVEAEQRLRVLAAAGRVLEAEGELVPRLQQLVGVVVPDLADVCAVYLVRNGMARPVAQAPARTSGAELLEDALADAHPYVADAVRQGTPVRCPPGAERPLLVVPLPARGVALGALVLARADVDAPYGADDLEVAQELGRQVGFAVDNVWLLADERRSRAMSDRARRQVERLASLATALAETVAPEDVGATVLRELIDVIDADAGGVWRAHGEGWQVLASKGELGAEPARLPLPESVAADVRRSGQPVWLRDRDGFARPAAGEPGPVTASGHGSLLILPFPNADGVGAVAVLSFQLVRTPTLAEEEFARAASRQAGLALARAEALQAETRGRHRSSFIAEASLELEAATDVDGRLSRLAHVVVPSFADTFVAFTLTGGRLRLAAVAAPDAAATDALRARIDSWLDPSDPAAEGGPAGLASLVDLERPSTRLWQAMEDEPSFLAALGAAGALVVEMPARGRTLGVLAFGCADPGRGFDDDDRALAVELGRRAGLAVDNARLFEEAQAAAAVEARRAERMDELADASLAVHAALGMDARASATAARAAGLVDADLARVSVWALPRGGPTVEASWVRPGAPVPRAVESAEWTAPWRDEVARSRRALRLDPPAAPPAWAGPSAATPQRGDGGWSPSAAWLGVTLPRRDASTMGVVEVLRTSGAFDADDEWMLAELGRSASLAISNAWLEERERTIARTLQESLLPSRLPAVPGFDIAARYVAGGTGMDVGGDLYDVMHDGAAWAFLVGDVCGKGAEAAAVTALIRYTVRAEVGHGLPPAAALLRAHDAIRAQRGDGRFCSAALAVLRPPPGSSDGAGRPWQLSLARAGHPPPLLASAGGSVQALEPPGTLLGTHVRAQVGELTAHVGPGDYLVMYTDGLVEGRREGEEYGEARLSATVGTLARQALAADELADVLLADVLDWQGGHARDDIAVLVVRRAAGR